MVTTIGDRSAKGGVKATGSTSIASLIRRTLESGSMIKGMGKELCVVKTKATFTKVSGNAATKVALVKKSHRRESTTEVG